MATPHNVRLESLQCDEPLLLSFVSAAFELSPSYLHNKSCEGCQRKLLWF